MMKPDCLIKMIEEGLPDKFIIDTLFASKMYEGVDELTRLWYVETDGSEKDEIIADIQELIFDTMQEGHDVDPIDCQDIDLLMEKNQNTRKSILSIIHNDIHLFSERSGLPISFLNRFFNSVSTPNKHLLKYLYKIIERDYKEVIND